MRYLQDHCKIWFSHNNWLHGRNTLNLWVYAFKGEGYESLKKCRAVQIDTLYHKRWFHQFGVAVSLITLEAERRDDETSHRL